MINPDEWCRNHLNVDLDRFVDPVCKKAEPRWLQALVAMKQRVAPLRINLCPIYLEEDLLPRKVEVLSKPRGFGVDSGLIINDSDLAGVLVDGQWRIARRIIAPVMIDPVKISDSVSRLEVASFVEDPTDYSLQLVDALDALKIGARTDIIWNRLNDQIPGWQDELQKNEELRWILEK